MLPRFADIFQQGNRWLNWLEKQPVQMSRLEHYAGQDEIGLRYNTTGQNEKKPCDEWRRVYGKVLLALWRIRGSGW
ncbi:transposase [Escherichia coli]|nr:transposase [Escherichia coli]